MMHLTLQIKEIIISVSQIARDVVLDVLFPKPSDIQELEKLSPNQAYDLFPKCIDSPQGINAIFDYRDTGLRKLIWELKYRKSSHAANIFGELLFEHILEDVSSLNTFNSSQILLLPVPTSKERRLEKGYNQTEFLCEAIKKHDHTNSLTYSPHLLKKHRHTPPQTGSNRHRRLQNIKGCFLAKNLKDIKDKNVIIIDDVITTGSTVSEIKKMLYKAGARHIMCWAIAH